MTHPGAESPDEILPPGADRGPAVPGGAEWVREAALLLPNLVKLLSRLLRDPRVPRRRRMLAWAVLGYLAWPFDVVPDVVPVLGQSDDLLLVVLALHHLVNEAGEDVVREHWDGSQDVLEVIRGVLDWGFQRIPWPVRRAVGRFVARP